MNLETVFSIVNTLVLPQWLLMIFAPNWRWTQKLANSYLIPLLLAIVYAYYIFTGLGDLDFWAFSTLAGVMKLFTIEQGVLAGWIHYLCFDLVTGSWIFKDSLARGNNRVAIGICLMFCFMLGPIGLLLYLGVRRFA